jgi:hypothetical protein
MPTLRGGQPASARPSLADLADVLADGRLRLHDLALLAYFGLHRHAARYRAGRILDGTPPTCTARPAPKA